MRARHPLPTLWLVTDERVADDALLAAAERLPRGAAVLFRHYGLPRRERRALYEQVRAICRRRRLALILAGGPGQATAWKADGFHDRRRQGPARMIHSAPVHDLREVCAAEAAGADIVLLSPVFATRSHPGAIALGRRRFAALTRQTALPVIALGGMTAQRWPAIRKAGAHGWAAVDGLTPCPSFP